MGYIRSRLKSFQFAFAGIKMLFLTQPNFRIHVMALLLVNGLAWYLDIQPFEWLALWLCSGMVLVAEAVNSSIEETINLLHPARNPLAGRIKDMAAAAVLMAAIISVVVGLIVFVPYFL